MSVIRNTAKQRLTAGELSLGIGARFILSGSDFSFVMVGANARSSFLRGIKP